MMTLLSALVGDDEIAAHFGDAADLDAMRCFEVALAEAEAKVGLIPVEAAEAIAKAAENFAPNMAALAASMRRDGVQGPGFVTQLREIVPEPHREYVHFGATSQDVVDSSLVLRLKPVIVELRKRLEHLIIYLEQIQVRDGSLRLMAHTRMKEALEFTAGHKIETWLRPLRRILERLTDVAARLLVVQLGGAVGTREKFGTRADELTSRLASHLGLAAAEPWHVARDNLTDFGNWLSLLTGTLAKIGNDLVLMGQDKIGQLRLQSGGHSSAMPHKQNPVAAEVLIALGRYNAGQLALLHQALIHENERSGAAWTLEWMVLPTMVIAAAAALRHAQDLAQGMVFVGCSPTR